jgi:hypothetical protein
MAKPKASEIAAKFKWDIADLTDFCADVLEDANDHNAAAALRAMNVGEYGLARDFIQLEEDHVKAGELTPELNSLRGELLARLRAAAKGEPS